MWTKLSRLVKRRFSAMGLVGVMACVAPIVSGCMMGRMVTPADLERNGTKVYAGHGRQEVVKASALALRTLGYEVVLEDVPSGRVKTAPKVVQVLAVGGSSMARAYANEIAWSLEISNDGSQTVVKAVPRASTNGQPVDMGNVNADYMDRTFSTLWGEIDANLGQKPASKAATGRARSDGSTTPSPLKKKGMWSGI